MAKNDKLTAEGKRFFRELKKLSEKQVRVGVQGGKRHKEKSRDGKEKEGADLVDIAIWNELGTDRIPARPFLGQTVDQHGAEIQKAAAQLVQKICKGQLDAQSALNNLGVLMVGYVQNQISDGDFIPNAPSTIRLKGSERPLINTKQLRGSISPMVCKKGEYD